MKLNFYPFHKHSYKVIKWRLVHAPDHEPSRRMIRLKCTSCNEEKNYFPKAERSLVWEYYNRHLEGYWSDTTIKEGEL